jgi:hypothetical protein
LKSQFVKKPLILILEFRETFRELNKKDKTRAERIDYKKVRLDEFSNERSEIQREKMKRVMENNLMLYVENVWVSCKKTGRFFLD